MNRKQRKGFTLVELMVVILILGILAAVIGVAVTGIMAENKVNLDAQSLTDFTKKLELDLNTSKRYIVKEEGERAADLYVNLFKQGRIDEETVKKLSGVTGTEITGEEFKSGAWTTDANVIFTGPNTGKSLIEGFSATRTEWGILFSYNKYSLKSNAKQGIVIRWPGGGAAKKFPVADLIAESKLIENPDFILADDFNLATAEPYGKGMFANVLPE